MYRYLLLTGGRDIIRVVLAVFIIIIFPVICYAGIPWPMEPFDSAQPIGNSYGEFQNYSGSASGSYMHPGIDILRPAGTKVYAVKAGWVKAVLTTSASLHWRVAIGDSASAVECDGWLYAHLDQFTITVTEGEYVDSGQYLGDLVFWPTSDFHHLHFVKIRNSGMTWASDWQFVGNPLDELVNIDDFSAPYFEDILGVPFSFCEDNTNNYFTVGASLTGDVDIIASIHDTIGHPDWVLTPYSIGYEILSDSLSYGPFTSFVFSGNLPWDAVQYTVYKRSAPCFSQGDYDDRNYFEIITNHDNDALLEESDTTGKWATGLIPNGDYLIRVWAFDKYGNSAIDSMSVNTENYYDIDGEVVFTDGNPFLEDIVVDVPFAVKEDTTNIDGEFLFSSLPAGRYDFTTSRIGYETVVEQQEIFGNNFVTLTLTPGSFVNGDVDYSGEVDISDAVYLIHFIFSGGPYPIPWASGVNIDETLDIDISDAVYLINYIFGGGPAPGE